MTGPERWASRQHLRFGAAFIATAVVYFVTAKLGLSLAFEAEQVTAVWPPTGIALAAVLLAGHRIWPAVWLGAFVANATAHEPLLTAAGIASGNTLEAVLGAWLLRHTVGFGRSIERVRDALGLIGLGALVSTTVSATVGASSLVVSGTQPGALFPRIWLTWWLGDAMGALVTAPVVLALAGRPRRGPRGRALELVILLVILTLISVAVFAGGFGRVISEHPLEYTIFPFVIWGALRLGDVGATSVTFVASTIAIWGTARDLGPFAGGVPPHQSLILLQLFLGVVASTGLLLAAAMSEREVAERRRAADHAVTHALAASRSLTEAAPRILRAVCESLRWPTGALWLVDQPAGMLRCLEVWLASDRRFSGFEAATRQGAFPAGVGLPGRVWADGRAAWILDVVHDPNFPRAAIAAREGLHAAFGFPIVRGGRVAGVAEFLSEEVRRPDADLLEMMTAIGIQIGQFIERKEAEDELAALLAREQAARADAEAASRAKDEFLAMLGHELRNPLGAITTAVAVLEKLGGDVERSAHPRAIIARQVAHLSRLVNDLLDVARVTSGKIALQRQAVDLDEIAERCLTGLHQARRAAQHVITLYGESVWVHGDPTRLEQVVANLLDNAVKYTPSGGRITVTVGRENEEAVLAVQDTGVGIAPDVLPHIFDLFVQGSQSLDRAQGGLGMGLTLAKRLVELHGGRIAVSSEGTGRGSTFAVRLPLMPRWIDPVAGAVPPPLGPPRRVLVIEDHRDARESLCMLLRQWGHEVTEAEDGPRGLERLLATRPDVALVDVGLPGRDGYSLARTFRSAAGSDTVYLVALTGYGQPEDRQRAHEAGFDAHLVKPVSETDLLEVLRKAPARS